MPVAICADWATRFRAILLATLFAVALHASNERPAVANTLTLDSAVEVGISMERKKQWNEAVDHYKTALDSWPENNSLKWGLRRSKIQLGIRRRYTDSSYRTKLALSTSRALSLFEDVLHHVHSSFVDPISTTSFVAHGTESLYLALANDAFIKRNLRGATRNEIRALRKRLKNDYWNRPIHRQQDAKSVVLEVCRLADQNCHLSATVVVMEYVFGGCNALDDYSSMLTPDRLDDLLENIDGEFVGLGIEMQAEPEKGLRLINVLPNSPASEGGLSRGQLIVAIDGVDCRSMPTDEAASRLGGAPGSRVRLHVSDSNGENTRELTFSRREVKVHSVAEARFVDSAKGIAYIRMTGFQKSTPRELDDALRSLHRRGMRALIWDLRGNPGGLLTAAWRVVDRFVDDGVLVSTRGRQRSQNYRYTARSTGTWKVPLVLLIDGDSASASEIVAGAIKDLNRGTLVGRKTYGKWSVQTILPLQSSMGLRLTTARFYSPMGRTLGGVGVEPDVLVERDEQHTAYYGGPQGDAADDDPDLRAGVGVLRRQLDR